ncbi:hypothetical protein ABDK96_01130 [Citricoccus nitrophenolicus]|uniref:Uncharacterized protein n=1 Tax=Citricoccus nitrophenolicus TaxID=863575 RepID=A0ABV0IFM0_9MICC
MPVTQRLFGTRWPRWTSDWLLSRGERGNDAAGVGTRSGGKAVRLIPHGVDYFAALDRELADVGPGDLVLVAGWRFSTAISGSGQTPRWPRPSPAAPAAGPWSGAWPGGPTHPGLSAP